MTDNIKIIELLEVMSEDVVCSVTDKDGKTFFVYYKDILEIINRQKAEIERLQKKVVFDLNNFASEYDSKIKAEAIKEFAERLKENSSSFQMYGEPAHSIVTIDGIDYLVKEMVGDAE